MSYAEKTINMRCYFCGYEWKSIEFSEDVLFCPNCNRKVVDSSCCTEAVELLMKLKYHSLLELYLNNQAMQQIFLYSLNSELLKEYIDAVKHDDLSRRVYSLILERTIEKRIDGRSKLYSLHEDKRWREIVDDFVYPLKEFFHYSSSIQNNEEEWEDEYGGVYSSDGKKFIKFIGSSSKYRILDGTLVVVNDAFMHNTSLIEINIPNSVVVIGDRAFSFCENLKIIDTYSTRKTNKHEKDAVYHNKRGHCNYTIGENVFIGSFKLETIVLPCKIECIFDNSFLGNLKTLTLPENLRFCVCLNLGRCNKLHNLICDSKNFTNDNELFYENKKGLLYASFIKNDFYIIPSYIYRIMPCAFAKNEYLKGVIVPDCVCWIDDNAFMDCKNLEYIQILSSDVGIGENILHEYFPISNIEDDPFSVIYSLKAIIIPIGSLKHYENEYDLAKYLVESDEIATCYSDFERIVNEARVKENVPKVYGHILNGLDCQVNEEKYYEEYKGTYAQDEMGYSDDDIDTIFDGNPDAYWNID